MKLQFFANIVAVLGASAFAFAPQQVNAGCAVSEHSYCVKTDGSMKIVESSNCSVVTCSVGMEATQQYMLFSINSYDFEVLLMSEKLKDGIPTLNGKPISIDTAIINFDINGYADEAITTINSSDDEKFILYERK
jgi:putative hemolysin